LFLGPGSRFEEKAAGDVAIAEEEKVAGDVPVVQEEQTAPEVPVVEDGKAAPDLLPEEKVPCLVHGGNC
jgi:hypothetical protein